MLTELHVRDLALIEEVWLGFGSGMTVLTGETGAGKTVLVGALKLLLGERGDSTLVRAGAKEALVEGAFSVVGADASSGAGTTDGAGDTGDVSDADTTADTPDDAGTTADIEMLVSRRLGADSRSRCRIDGGLANVGALAERVGPLVDLHGQHDHQALLKPALHAGYLDRWAGERVETALHTYRQAFYAHRAAAAAYKKALAHAESAVRDEERMRFALVEIDAVAPQLGEDELLSARLSVLQHAEKLSQACSEASSALRGEAGAFDKVAKAAGALARVAGVDPGLDGLAERLAEAETLVDDIGTALRTYRDGIDHDPHALDEAFSRLSALSGLKKKFGPSLEQVLSVRDEARAALDDSAASDEALAASRAAETAAASALKEAGEALSHERRQAVTGFTRDLAEAARRLAMGGASFDVCFAELPFSAWTANGPDNAEFMYSAAAGQPFRPLSRIASGGEISRVMLALKTVLGRADRVETLVFDEVDSGIGGQTALAVGRELKRLACTHQVIVVTHLAQVAAFADAHLVVEKAGPDGAVRTTVRMAEGEERAAEIARMLAGEVSQVSMAHAHELLALCDEGPHDKPQLNRMIDATPNRTIHTPPNRAVDAEGCDA
ncbi:MAG: DNA repair protein RecN [Coriobacteriia bacterium]|nr:DNA repair protein RecN [Coriobacteriia bacterium]